jgi:hypothetical protein
MKKLLLPLLIASASSLTHASVDLIAIGSLTNTSDLSGLSAPLENGVAGNLLGGIGSGFAWAGGNTFLALPDRGPNATPYNSAVSDTVSYISRFQTVTMNLTQSSSGALPYTLAPTLTATTLLSSPTALNYGSGAGMGNKIDGVTPIGSGAPALNITNNTNYFTGRADGFAAGSSTNPNNARLDPESIRVSNDGKSVFISDEYGPYIYKFDRATGERISTIAVPANLAATTLSANGDVEINNNSVGRVANKGMEGLAISPDGKTLVGIMQANLEQDAKKSLRILTINTETGEQHEYGYKLTTGSGVSEIVALNDHQFLVDERDGAGLGDGSVAAFKQLFIIDINGAQDISGIQNLTTSNFTAVTKSSTPFLDIKTALVAAGINAADIPAKIEGVAFGDDIVINGTTKHTLYVANDNDFLANVLNANGQLIANTNNFYLFTFTDADLNATLAGASFQQQNISAVPVPAAAWLFGSAAVALFGARRKSKAARV